MKKRLALVVLVLAVSLLPFINAATVSHTAEQVRNGTFSGNFNFLVDKFSIFDRITSVIRFFIAENGNVGIGNTIPNSTLHVSGKINASDDVCTEAGGGKCLSDAGTGGSGSLTCPAGTSLIGASDSPTAFCAEDSERSATTWQEASATCRNAGRRLCTQDEFVFGCNSGLGSGWNDNYEFTSDITPREGFPGQTWSVLIGGVPGVCRSISYNFVYEPSGTNVPYPYRCCISGSGMGGGGSGGGTMNTWEVNKSDTVSTSSTAFVDMPDMSLTFSLASPSKVLTSFSAESCGSGTQGGIWSTYRMVIDGSEAVQSTTNYNVIGNVHMQRILELGAGAHTLKVEWKTSGGSIDCPYNPGAQGGPGHRALNVIELTGGSGGGSGSGGWTDDGTNVRLTDIGDNVGIGTSTPAEKLDVAGQVHATGDVCTDASGGRCLSDITSGIDEFEIDTGATLQNGLVAYWKLDEAYAGGVRKDSYLTNHLKHVNAPAPVAGKKGNAANFISTKSQYLKLDDLIYIRTDDGNFSIAGWFNAAAIGNGRVVANRYWDGLYHGYDLQVVSNQRLRFHLGDSELQSSVVYNLGQWHFFVIWYDISDGKMYMQIDNGVVDSMNQLGDRAVLPSVATPFTIGNDAYSDYFDGMIDEVGMWKKVLTAQERADLYNSGSGNIYWP